MTPGRPRFDIPGLDSYFGGKGANGTFHRIINVMPPHDVYIEAFLGSGRVLRIKEPAPVATHGIERDARIVDRWHHAPDSYAHVHEGSAFDILPAIIAGHIARGVMLERILVYCDPPYLLERRKSDAPVYHHEFGDEDHLALLAMVAGLKCRVIVSHLHCQLYASALCAWHTFTFDNTTRHGLQLEQVWCNFRPGAELHEYTYIGRDFRERERLKRQFSIMLRRFDALPAPARIALLAMLDARRGSDEGSPVARELVTSGQTLHE